MWMRMATSCQVWPSLARMTSAPTAPPRPSGIDLDTLDPDTRPQDDLYRFVNGRWLARHEIPADRAVDGAFRILHDRAEEHVREIILEAGAAALDAGGTGDGDAASHGAATGN